MNAPKAPGLASRARAGWSGGERAEGARQATSEGRQALRGVSARPVARYRHPHRDKPSFGGLLTTRRRAAGLAEP
ncbi:hypothetical protein E3E14_07230 [Streptomyces sp. ICN441]|nr:hypothetical protein E3E14_07230 [Streptomyces sp. ICN441]